MKGFFFVFLWCWSLNSGLTRWATPSALFVLGIFEIGFHKLFAQVGFKPDLWFQEQVKLTNFFQGTI
jgi:hypothetical protein